MSTAAVEIPLVSQLREGKELVKGDVQSPNDEDKPIGETAPSALRHLESSTTAAVGFEANTTDESTTIPNLENKDYPTVEPAEGHESKVDFVQKGDIDPEGKGDTAEEQKDESPPATLYCTINGRLHSTLLDFGVTICPKCNQCVAQRSALQDNNEKEKKKDNEKKNEKENEVKEIIHKVEFRDSENWFLARKSLKGPFDLEEARKEVEFKPDKTIVTIVTVLTTSHPGDRLRTATEKKAILKAGIFDNPQVEVTVRSTKMTITSVALVSALQKVVTYYPGTNLQGRRLELVEPFSILAHHLKELKTFRATFDEAESTPAENSVSTHTPLALRKTNSGKCTEVAYKHIGKLLDLLKNNIYKHHLAEEQARHAQDPPVCTFSMLWLLYRPGSTVYVESDGQLEAHVVQEINVDESVLSSPFGDLKQCTITLWHLSFDGRYVRRATTTMAIAALRKRGQYHLSKSFLPHLPTGLMEARSEIGSLTTVANGTNFFEGGSSIMSGGLWDTQSEARLDTRVLINVASYLELHNEKDGMEKFEVKDLGKNLPACPCEGCLGLRPHPPSDFPWTNYDMINPLDEKSLELPEGYEDRDHRYLLCTRRLMGFVLKSRSWEILDVACCQPPKINTKAIDTLVMPPERKRMIKAIVQKYTDPRFTPGKTTQPWGADFIENKGEGQIFLLHGSPGVGKTYPAKCISELIGRPLLSLTCADFGTDEIQMEKQFLKWFKLAESWGAVMLLDEADVWLERRMISDLKRNSMVAVFLRCMEYYRGILFLTTNRVGTFDDAFVSRIHVVIHYEDLGEDQRRQIWKQFFDKLERERKDSIFIDSRAKRYVLDDSEMKKIAWNGREIRNAFQTAVALAEYRFHFEGGKDESDMAVLDKMDFEQVCQMSVDFKTYMKDVHGADENERAMKDRIRAG
ncbi:related to TOB3 (member of AAA-ATPase family) [Phialocephala subalpina]|uniref:Related to TOB3 (Member of AAA-ATPase family) n=1 Tax=Phialocephala subalpina TaxID=576137 RepID=A0A1L7WVA5_9HELO|nr:related to TOB3 (member of AAA-ATPase family) [Phialocephala subalpina]